MRLNPHKLLEIVIPLEDVTLLGTKNYIQNIQEVANRLQVRVDKTALNEDAYEYCMNRNASCRQLLPTEYSSIYNSLIEYHYANYTTMNKSEIDSLLGKVD